MPYSMNNVVIGLADPGHPLGSIDRRWEIRKGQVKRFFIVRWKIYDLRKIALLYNIQNLLLRLPLLYPLRYLHVTLLYITAIKISINQNMIISIRQNPRYRGSYMSAHVLLNLLNELGKRDKMRGLPSILSLFSQRV